jgi:hypothetical protein
VPIARAVSEQLAPLVIEAIGRGQTGTILQARVEEVAHLLAPVGLETPDHEEPVVVGELGDLRPPTA